MIKKYLTPVLFTSEEVKKYDMRVKRFVEVVKLSDLKKEIKPIVNFIVDYYTKVFERKQWFYDTNQIIGVLNHRPHKEAIINQLKQNWGI